MMLKIKEKKSHLGTIICTLVMVLAIAVCLFAGSNLYNIWAEYKAGTDEYSKIQDMAVTEIQPSAEVRKEVVLPDAEEDQTWDAPIEIDFASLQVVNKDIEGWIYVEAIPTISYPVVQGEDNDYYLHRTFEKQDNFAGTLFLDYKNTEQFESPNTIIYGHNMKNGSMFGRLKEFRERETYDTSPYIWILTPEGDFKYQIFSAYVAEVDSDTYTLIKGPGKELVDYAERMQGYSSIICERTAFESTDKIITLSTCTGDDSTRYVVQAVRI